MELQTSRTVRNLFLASTALVFIVGQPALTQASVLTFEVFDSGLQGTDPGQFQDPAILPTYPGYGYIEGFRVPDDYGDAIADPSLDVFDSGTRVYQYGTAHGATPEVNVSYGPFSIFTGGPNLWREGYSDLNGVLYQGASSENSDLGFDYDFLDIVLYASPGFDVVLYGFELGASISLGVIDPIIDGVFVFDGAPNALFTPDNFMLEDRNVPLSSTTSTQYAFDADPLQAHVVWIRIDASILGDDSRSIGIDNIRFGQVVNDTDPESQLLIDPADIDGVLQQAPVPEAASIAIWLIGGGIASAVFARSRRKQD